jgi:uncharacterized membrane protein YfhO
MLNTKFIIVDPKTFPMMNYYRLGNAWFVENIKQVDNADQEIAAVRSFSPEVTAIVDKRFANQLVPFQKDTTAVIQLSEYKPNEIIYHSKTSSDQIAIFSEIYYEKGWKAYIDGQYAPHFRANYVLRGMKIPAGEHVIKFRFESEIWKTGNNIATAGSIILILVLLGGTYWIIRNRKQENIT